jgi:hypothetical protein
LQVVDPTTRLARIWLVGVDGQDLRPITDPFPAPATLPGVHWIEGGRTLTFAGRGSGHLGQGVESFRLMRLDATGGIPTFAGFETPGWTSVLAPSPDATQVVVDQFPISGAHQAVWSIPWPVGG